LASNLASILSAAKTLLGTIAALRGVHEAPAIPDDWVEQFRQVGTNLPAAHVYVGSSESVSAVTSGDLREQTALVVTCIFAREGASQATFVSLRDSVIAALWNAATLNAHCDECEPVSVKVDDQDAQFIRFTVEFRVTHIWEP
jgi:hypothetical protein